MKQGRHFEHTISNLNVAVESRPGLGGVPVLLTERRDQMSSTEAR